MRRLLALGLVVGLVWAVTALLGGDGDASQAAASQHEPGDAATSATSTPDSTPQAPVSAGRGASGQLDDTRPRVVTTALAGPEGECLAADVNVTPAVAGVPRGGSDVGLDLSVTTAGETPCRLELGPEVLAVKVSTGGTAVWDTVQCPGAVPERALVLRPGWTTAVTVTWPGIYGDKGCTGLTRDAPPGSYAAEAAVYEGEPGRVDFDLQPPAGRQTGEGRSEDRQGRPGGGPPRPAGEDAGAPSEP